VSTFSIAQSVSPALLTARDLELAVPGTYTTSQEVVQIQGFAPSIDVISSKQRPRKITLYGGCTALCRTSYAHTASHTYTHQYLHVFVADAVALLLRGCDVQVAMAASTASC
jgi:hypothetical protein